jgi:hypothetical protein
MTEYRTSEHAVWDIKYHLIWITKYRHKVLRGEVAAFMHCASGHGHFWCCGLGSGCGSLVSVIYHWGHKASNALNSRNRFTAN